MTDAPVPSDPLRQLLRGFPEPAIEACARFKATGSPADFDEAVCRVIQHHLEPPPTVDVQQMPPETRLVDDLRLDSLTMVELVFLLEDLFAAKVEQEELVKVATLGELRELLKSRLPARA